MKISSLTLFKVQYVLLGKINFFLGKVKVVLNQVI